MAEQVRALRIGTRSSPLALYQSRLVAQLLGDAAPDLACELVEMSTTGDRDGRSFREIGERGMFAKELEQALLAGEIDCAVHSLKDLRLELPDGLAIAAILPREDPRDAVCGDARSLESLPHGARIATGSMRRSAALRHARADIEPVAIRGNVQTRLRTARDRGDHGCMLAAAGLYRLGLADQIGFLLDVATFVPEAGQGAIAVQVRTGDLDALDWTPLDHEPTRWSVEVERLVAAALGGGCEVPLGVHVDLEAPSGVTGHVFAAAPDASAAARVSASIDRSAPPADAARVLLEAARREGVERLLQY